MDRRKRNKRCSVCGDIAVGFNFGVLACESCKAFFRRTAKKINSTKCLFNEQCAIGTATRRFCTHCRLLKCFNVGMKTCLILDERAKRVRQEKITHNRLMKSTAVPNCTPVFGDECSTRMDDVFLASSNQADNRSGVSTHTLNGGSMETFDQLVPPTMSSNGIPPLDSSFTNAKWRSFLDASTDDDPYNTLEQTDLFGCRGSLSTASPFSHNSGEPTSDPSGENPVVNPPALPPTCISNNVSADLQDNCLKEESSRLLSHCQWTAINDLRNAYETGFVEEESCPTLIQPDLTLSGLINTSRFLVRRLINFAKTLTDFSQLQQDCQITLLKGVVLSTLFLLSARHYDVEKDVWLTPKGEVSTQILRVATGMDKFYEEHTKYCRDFKALVAQDTNIVALMQTLCLFTPDRPALDARQTVANVHDRYSLLLKHYLEAKAGFAGGRSLLAAVLTNLRQLETLTMNCGHMLMRLDPTKIDPLLMEIFNLTPLSENQRTMHAV